MTAITESRIDNQDGNQRAWMIPTPEGVTSAQGVSGAETLLCLQGFDTSLKTSGTVSCPLNHRFTPSNLQSLRDRYPWPSEIPSVPSNLSGWLQPPNQKMLSQFCSSQTQVVVELGSWLGLSARFFLDIAPKAMVICVDHWQGSLEHHHNEKWRKMLPTLYETFLVNLWSYRDRIIPLKAGTIEGLKLIHSLGIHPDLIYIDASHEYDAVFRDVQTAMALFPKSTICGDDWSWDGVRQAVTENATYFQQTVFTEGGHAWYFQGMSHELTDPTYFTHCGVVLKSLECYQETKDAFKKALTLNPDNADAWSNLGQVMLI